MATPIPNFHLPTTHALQHKVPVKTWHTSRFPRYIKSRKGNFYPSSELSEFFGSECHNIIDSPGVSKEHDEPVQTKGVSGGIGHE